MPYVCGRCGKQSTTRVGLRCPACIENYARSADDSAADAAFIASVTGGPSYAPAANDATVPAMDAWMLERFAATVVRVLEAGTPPVVTVYVGADGVVGYVTNPGQAFSAAESPLTLVGTYDAQSTADQIAADIQATTTAALA
jgi:hypothetical protein